MLWVHLALVFTILCSCQGNDEETNEISLQQPSVNLDANLRRALLRALTELENEEREKSKQNNTAYQKETRIHDKVFEKAPVSQVSFFASTTPATTTTATTTTERGSSTTEENIVILQKSSGIQHRPIITLERNGRILNNDGEREQILTSASSSFTTPDKFLLINQNNQQKDGLGRVTANSLSITEKPTFRSTTAVPFLSSTTPSTTFAPTEENEAKVEDVQFFSAPLVAAFTLHQDERGVPKSVIPLYKQHEHTIETEKKIAQELLKREQQKQDLLRQQELQEKQRTFEEQLTKLQQQQQQQDFLLRQHQFFQEQQLQKQRILEEQERLQKNQQPFVPILNHSQNNQINFNRPQTSDNRGTLVSLEPSVTLAPNVTPFPNQFSNVAPSGQLQLPVRNSLDFNKYTFPQSSSFLPFSPVLQPPTIFPSVNFVTPQNNRIFRHETGVGNFLNSNGIRQQQLPLFDQRHRFFRTSQEGTQTSPFQARPPFVNQHLNNLLYNSGISRGRQEDLNIVSKVLSLNHLGGGDNFFGNSEVKEQRVPAPVVDKKTNDSV